MNAGNLEKVITRLPRWMQAKFAEHLKSLEGRGWLMPSFRNVVDFLKERAYVLNHLFFIVGLNEESNLRRLELKYRVVIEDCVAKGYARKLTKDELGTISNTTWYLPHHPVTNPNKPGKVRVVFDAAARFDGSSLNEQLVGGPTLTNDLTGVLFRFREDEIAFSADIESMFYQTYVTPRDTDSMRFLWWPGSVDNPPEDYKMLVHIFGAKLSPCCANKVLNQTAQDDEETYSPEVIKAVRRNFYVDNVFKSVPTPEQAIHLASDLTKLLKEGGFRLTKFTSNSREVLQAIPSELRASPNLDLDLDQLPTKRALGVY
ncbi:uncharacterized protein [Montipora foliosa]|uniref:uncharacterized protein n=1 Tax=Montipora foliosa TaxID=591990 RepID=UPI0035F16CDA